MSQTLGILLASATLAIAQPGADSKEWPTYGHDAGGMRYSPLTQITPANVAQLKVAWVYHMKPAVAAAPVTLAPASEVPADGAPPAGRGGRGGGGFAAGETT